MSVISLVNHSPPETDDESKQAEILRAAVAQLSDESQKVLATLFGFLSRVAARQNLNKMGPANLGTVSTLRNSTIFLAKLLLKVFGPNLFAAPEVLDLTLTMRHNKLATLLVERAEQLFQDSVNFAKGEEQHVAHITTALASGYLTNVSTAFGVSPSNSSTMVSAGSNTNTAAAAAGGASATVSPRAATIAVGSSATATSTTTPVAKTE